MIGLIVVGLLVLAVFAGLGLAIDRLGDRWRA